ncbi:MAG TPA: alkaline phosphatase family protein, partial [Rhodothermales bacterium]|nr:alkaline phosphatase family protein [Rhodothermales bacterium]
AGRHYGPYPHSATRPVLAARNVFRQIEALELPYEEPAGFANAYPPRFFTYARERDRWTVTTRCCLDADIPIRGEEALLEGRALSANLTGQGWPSDVPVPVIPEEEAGTQLARLSRQHAFLLYEYFLTDKAGHSQSASDAEAVLISLDRFFGALLDALSDDTLLVVTSDHGNLEDLSTRTHTLNPVPLVAIGPGATAFRDATELTGITPVIVELLH